MPKRRRKSSSRSSRNRSSALDEKQSRRIPPHSAEAERAVLGAMFRRESALVAVVERLQEEDFYLTAHREIFASMLELHTIARPVDEVTLVERLEQRNRLKDAGGAAYVAELHDALPTLANLPHYVQIIQQKASLRQLIGACEEIIDEAYNCGDEAEQVMASAEKRIFDISMQNVHGGLTQIGEAVGNAYFRISERATQTGITGLKSGFTGLDHKLSGLQKSDLVVVAGRPAMGKTSFAINIAQHAATREDAVVAVFSLEMSIDQLATRMLCTQALVDMQRVKTGQVEPEDWSSLANAIAPLAQSKLFVDDSAGVTLAEIRSKLRRLKIDQGKLDLVVIDYLQLMTYRGKADNRQQEISETTRQLKILARDLDVPVLLLSQLSRGPENRADHRPMVSDLRESGSIEQDADIVILLYRASVYDESADNIAQAIIAKHRNGPTGDVDLVWCGEYTLFKDLAEDDPPY